MVYCAALGGAIGVCLAFVSENIADQYETILIREEMTAELDAQIAQHGNDAGDQHLQRSPWKSVYLDRPGQAPTSPVWTHALATGVHEAPDDVFGSGDHFVGIGTAPVGRMVIVAGLPDSPDRERRFLEELAAMIALGIALGAWLGRLLAGGMLAPVLRLSHEVERADPGVELHGIADDHCHDEVGALANAFLRYQSRVNAAIEREVLFSVDAGHELRTPLTTLQGALDLLDAQIVQAPARRKIQRIRRSAAEIGLLIDALLLVAVSDEAVDHPASVVEWRGAIASALTEYQPELDHAQVRVGVRCAPDATIHAHPRLLATMLRLLLRAMANGSFGQDLHVDVDGAGLRLAAADTVPEAALAGSEDVPTAIDVQRSDEIAGLGMLRRLCERHRWRLVLEGAGSGSGLLPLRLLAPA